MKHSDNKWKDKKLGENLVLGSTTPRIAAQMWYQEVYDGYSAKEIAEVAKAPKKDLAKLKEVELKNWNKAGHFTQLVWKGSAEVGFGFGKLVVANYFPAGNMLTEFNENVLPPIKGSTTTCFEGHELAFSKIKTNNNENLERWKYHCPACWRTFSLDPNGHWACLECFYFICSACRKK